MLSGIKTIIGRKRINVCISLVVFLALLMSTCNVRVYAYDEPSEWAKEDIAALWKSGEFDSSYYVNFKDFMTREEFMYFAVRLFELLGNEEVVQNPGVRFVDSDNQWVLKGASVGITDGVGGGRFQPTSYLTREQFATIMIRITELGHLSLLGASDESYSDDDSLSSWAKNSVYIAKSNNIMNGVGNNNFGAASYITKEQVMVVVYRMLKNYDGKGFDFTGNSLSQVDISGIEGFRYDYLGSIVNVNNLTSMNTIDYLSGLYSGYVSSGVPNGTGVYFAEDGRVVSGVWVDGSIVGTGFIDYPDGRLYAGGVSGFKANGIGLLADYDGTKYYGEFVDDNKEGFGFRVNYNQLVKIGYWENNVFIEKNNYTKNGSSLSVTFNTAESKNYTDIVEYTNSVYIGKTDVYGNNIKDGHGAFYDSLSGIYSIGLWENGENLTNVYVNENSIYLEINENDGTRDYIGISGNDYIISGDFDDDLKLQGEFTAYVCEQFFGYGYMIDNIPVGYFEGHFFGKGGFVGTIRNFEPYHGLLTDRDNAVSTYE